MIISCECGSPLIIDTTTRLVGRPPRYRTECSGCGEEGGPIHIENVFIKKEGFDG
jgi:hypothetical protein